jgi:hypothetical protein
MGIDRVALLLFSEPIKNLHQLYGEWKDNGTVLLHRNPGERLQVTHLHGCGMLAEG